MPDQDEELLKAVDLALGGDWQAAHRIAQERSHDAIANWIHAVVHRMEGDLGNAGTGIAGAAGSRARGSRPRPSSGRSA